VCTWTGEPPDPVQGVIATPATIKQGGNACSDIHTAWLRHPAVMCYSLHMSQTTDSTIRGLSQSLMTDRQVTGVDSESKTF